MLLDYSTVIYRQTDVYNKMEKILQAMLLKKSITFALSLYIEFKIEIKCIILPTYM
jgi:hypothetical protein